MNLANIAISSGGSIHPLIIPSVETGGTGLMNPSIFIDDDGDILCILRHINYTLYHSENDQRFPSVWGPLQYLHPEEDRHLRTTNYLCRLDKNFEIINWTKIDTSLLDVEPIWTFVGLEDARLVKWGGKYYATGVRRDTTDTGEGRMELSELEIDKDTWTAKEISRFRIPPPIDLESALEKNWMPILDKKYQYVKWTRPTEIVEIAPEKKTCIQVSLKDGNVPTEVMEDQRGGSQVIHWSDKYIAVTHEVVHSPNYIGQKNSTYRHRLVVWDENFTLIGISPEKWSFLDGQVEFACGAAALDGDLLITFGYVDNAAFVLRVPGEVVNSMIDEATARVENVNV